VTLIASGCGPGVPSLSGTVTLDGRPLDSGQVTFQGANLPTAYAQIGADGSYAAKTGATSGIPAGTYQIAVAAYEEIPSKNPDTPPDRRLLTPKQYQSAEKSGLSFEVMQGSNEHNIELVGGE